VKTSTNCSVLARKHDHILSPQCGYGKLYSNVLPKVNIVFPGANSCLSVSDLCTL
jgi:hypothetical protein